MFLPSISLLPLLLFPTFAQEDVDPLPEADAAITVRELKHHVAFLASDELRGRAAGTEDAVRAARYLARALAQAGAAPAGDGQTYLQAMNLVRNKHARPPQVTAFDEEGNSHVYVHGIGFSLRARGGPGSVGPFPIHHAESVADIPSDPDPTVALFLDTDSREAAKWLQQAGNPNATGWGLLVTAGSKRDGRRESKPSSRLDVELFSAGEGSAVCDSLTARGAMLEALQDWTLTSLALSVEAERIVAIDYNVIGRIAGVGTPEQPGLAQECIVFSAHYDHIGVVGGGSGHGEADPDSKDLIFNGADDDATGTAAVVELAQAFAAGPPPARTLIFLLAAGEEVGLLGTRFYLEHPVAPLDQTVANLNYEMIGRPDSLAGGFGKLWLTGFERTTLGPAYQELGLGVVPDPRLSMNYFQRSDNYAFAVRGIVGQTLSSYNSHGDYHNVTDELETIDFEHMAAALKGGLKAAQLLADGSLRPDWLPGGKP